MIDEKNLTPYLVQYWVKTNRRGKHESMPMEHLKLLNSCLKVHAEDLFEQIYQNKFNPESCNAMQSWGNFLEQAKLKEYLDESYVPMALEITSKQPAIGVGEFLFVSCYCNLAFASDAGDLITLDTKKKIELKGNRSSLSGDRKNYKTMNTSVMTSIYSPFNQNAASANHDHFNRHEAMNLAEIIKSHNATDNQVIQMFMHLQNNIDESYKLAKCATQLYRQGIDLFTLAGAEQLCNYLYTEHADYLMMTNKEGYVCFQNPIAGKSLNNITVDDLSNAVRIVNNISLSSWDASTKGMSISI